MEGPGADPLPVRLAAGDQRAFDALPSSRVGLAAEQYRAQHGKFPARLDDLTPDFIPVVPLDPFDGKPMRMKRAEHGLIVYSIGPDMVDNGGAPLDHQKNTGDITFEMPDGKP